MVSLFLSVGNSAFCEVVWGHFDPDCVTRENADEVQPHFAGNVSEYAMPVSQFDAEHGIWQQLDDLTGYFNSVFLRHVNTSGSPFVTSTVCSK